MSDRLFAFWAFLKYWLRQEDQYSFQGPFVSDLYSGLLHFFKSQEKANLDIEEWRQDLLENHHEIEVLDLGAGSKKVNQTSRKISAITKHSTSGRKFCQLYQYFASLTPAETILELGTCTGISTRYLAAVSKGQVFTFEGSDTIQEVAQRNTANLPIKFISGDISLTLPEFLSSTDIVDFALVDANHTYEGTIESFNHLVEVINSTSILAIADIHWSPGMQKAWDEIKKHPRVKLSLDFYEAGILIFESPQKDPEHLVVGI